LYLLGVVVVGVVVGGGVVVVVGVVATILDMTTSLLYGIKRHHRWSPLIRSQKGTYRHIVSHSHTPYGSNQVTPTLKNILKLGFH